MAAFLLGPRNPVSGQVAPIPVLMQPKITSAWLREGSTAFYLRAARTIEPPGSMTKRVLLSALILMAILQQAVAEEIILSCIIHLPSSDKTFMSRLEITDQRVIGDGTNITKDITI